MVLLHLGHEKSPFPSILVKSNLYAWTCSIYLPYLLLSVSVYNIKLLQDETTFASILVKQSTIRSDPFVLKMIADFEMVCVGD